MLFRSPPTRPTHHTPPLLPSTLCYAGIHSHPTQVKKASVMYDPHTRESRGFGFVTMESAEEADAAVAALHGAELGRKVCNVEKVRFRCGRTYSFRSTTPLQLRAGLFGPFSLLLYASVLPFPSTSPLRTFSLHHRLQVLSKSIQHGAVVRCPRTFKA